jgi:hypothetical protein
VAEPADDEEASAPRTAKASTKGKARAAEPVDTISSATFTPPTKAAAPAAIGKTASIKSESASADSEGSGTDGRGKKRSRRTTVTKANASRNASPSPEPSSSKRSRTSAPQPPLIPAPIPVCATRSVLLPTRTNPLVVHSLLDERDALHD